MKKNKLEIALIESSYNTDEIFKKIKKYLPQNNLASLLEIEKIRSNHNYYLYLVFTKNKNYVLGKANIEKTPSLVIIKQIETINYREDKPENKLNWLGTIFLQKIFEENKQKLFKINSVLKESRTFYEKALTKLKNNWFIKDFHREKSNILIYK